MPISSVRRSSPVTCLLALLALVTACGASDSSTAPDREETQVASASAAPTSASVARGGTTPVTVSYRATGGLVIGQSYTINMSVEGLTVNQVSSTTAGSTITTVYSVGANASVPIGTHTVRFSTPVSGYTGTGSVPTAIVATFSLTVTN